MAYGSFVPSFANTTPGPATNTTFNYALIFNTGQSAGGQPFERLEAGDFLTIYDIEGFVSAAAPAGFSVSTQNVGITAFGTFPTDVPSVVNVTYTYTGSTQTADTA